MGSSEPDNRRPVGAHRAATVVLCAALGLLLVPTAASAGGGVAVRGAESSGVRSYWTPKRMRAATPVEAPSPDAGGGGAPVEPTGSAAVVDPVRAGERDRVRLEAGTVGREPTTRAASVKRDEITDPSAEPYRSHGKVFFTISGGSAPGDYVCSGTALASHNRSVVWTAGHCVFDTLGGGYAKNWMFAPAYHNGSTPYGEWPAKQLASPKQWRQDENLSYDLGAVVVSKNPQGQHLTDLVGGRGIGFNQPRSQTYAAFGYPAEQPPLEFTGGREFRCTAELGGTDNPPGSGPNTNWIPCDMTGGSSGGGWIASGDLLSVNSYSYCLAGLGCEKRLYGPYLDSTAENLYRSVAGEAQFCAGHEVTVLGTAGPDRLVGTAGRDVFKARGGRDTIIGKGGRDIVCAGSGRDVIKGKRGRDKLKGKRGRDVLRGGRGRDFCNGGSGRDKGRSCERSRRIP